MATELGKAYVQLIPSAQGISGMIEKELGGNGGAEAAGASFGTKLVAGLAKVIAAAGIGMILKKSIFEGAELEQNLGGTEAVFGSFAQTIQASATQAYKNMGLSASDYMATANKMGSLFQGSGLDQQRALDLTSQAMQRAADVASVMGLDTSMAMESIAGAAKGNFTMMDNLGVAMNATTLQAYALEKGVNFNWNTASNAEKAELAMQMFFDRTTQYAGNFARESEDTFSGSLGEMQASWQNLLGNLMMGESVGSAMASLVQTALVFGGNLIKALLNIVMSLPEAAMAAVTTLGPMLSTTGVATVTSFVSGFSSNFPAVMTAGFEAITALLASIIAALPQMYSTAAELIGQFITGFLSGLPSVIQSAGMMIITLLDTVLANLPSIMASGFNLLGTFVTGLLNNLPAIISSIWTVIIKIIATVAQHLPEILQSGIELLGEFAAGIIQAIPDLVGRLPEVISSIQKTFDDYDWIAIGVNILTGIADGITNAIGDLLGAAIDACSRLVSGVEDFFGINSPSRLMADRIGQYIPSGIGVGITANMAPLRKAVEGMDGMVLDSSLQGILSGQRYRPQPAFAGSAGTAVYQTNSFYTHDSLSPAELTREAEDMAERLKWSIP